MLAQNFKTAADLGISEEQHQSLIQTLGRMERMEIPEHQFSMRVVGEPDCGTPGCILGWARGTRQNPVWATRFPRRLERLFLPHHCPAAWGASTEQAAIALRSYLTTGVVNWADALAI